MKKKNKDLFKKKVKADKFLEQLREEEDPRVLKFISKMVKHDKNERFEKVVV